jgi:hypothetical protein
VEDKDEKKSGEETKRMMYVFLTPKEAFMGIPQTKRALGMAGWSTALFMGTEKKAGRHT